MRIILSAEYHLTSLMTSRTDEQGKHMTRSNRIARSFHRKASSLLADQSQYKLIYFEANALSHRAQQCSSHISIRPIMEINEKQNSEVELGC